MKKKILALCLLAGAALTSFARPSVLSLKESIQDSTIVYPQSFETNTQELMKNWYLKNYAVVDRSGANLSDVPTQDRDFITRLKSMPTVIEMPYNGVVRSYINMYTQRRRQLVEEMLGLSLYYMPFFEQALEKEGMPLELKYLPVIESALNPDAVSRVGATGLWQFMLSTAKGLGLEVNSIIDERRDPIRSSEMAAKYLKQLYNIYGDWSLAIASYNCGPGNVNKALRRAGGTDDKKKDFWDIYFYLPQETRGYVPAFIAANYVMTYYKDHNLGKSLAKRPILTDTIHVNKRVHFEQISSVLNIPMEELRVLNPQYRKDVIPGDIHPYTLTLPSQQIYSYIVSEDSIVAHNAALYARREVVEPVSTTVSADNTTTTTKLVTKYHTVGRNETISKVARKYGVSVASIKKWNGLRSNKLRRGQTLKINTYKKVRVEVPDNKDEENVEAEEPMMAENTAPQREEPAQKTEQAAPQKPAKTEKPQQKPAKQEVRNPEYHKVQRGETLTSIANQYGVSVADLKDWNNLSSGNVMAGQTLVVDAKKAVKKKKETTTAATTHTVKSGENLTSIANQYGVSVDDIREWNDLSNDNIRIGDKLKLHADGKSQKSDKRSSKNEPAEQTHKVQKGETLGKIAEKYGVSVDDLRKWNKISGNNIAAGQDLVVYSDKKVSKAADKSDSKSSKKKETTSKKTHKVKKGETLSQIADKYGVGLSKLKKANGISGNNIQVGQTLKIPK